MSVCSFTQATAPSIVRTEGPERILVTMAATRRHTGCAWPATTAVMGIDFLSLGDRATVGTTLEAVRDSEISPEAVAAVLTHDRDGRLDGAIRLVPLLPHAREALLVDVVEHACAHLHPDREVRDIVVMMSDFTLTVAPAVDRDHRMLGVVTVDDLLETLIPDRWKWRTNANHEG